MKPFLLISFSLSCCLLALSAYAKDYPGYHQYSAGLLTGVKLMIPVVSNQDRFYITSRFHEPVVNASLLIDNQLLVKPFGTTQTSSMPNWLLYGYGKQLPEIVSFPVAPLKASKSAVILYFQMDSGKEKKITLNGKSLTKLLHDIR
jgi:hypothetical protein